MKWTLVETNEKLRELQARLVSADRFTFDTETTGLRWWRDRWFLASFCDGQQAWLLPRKEFDDGVLADFFQAIFANPAKKVIGQNIKFDLHFIKHDLGVDCRRITHDTKVMAHLMDENRQNSLKPLCKALLGIEPVEEAAVKEWLEKAFDKKADYDYSKVPDEIMYPYSVQDAILTWKLYEHLQPSIEQHFLELYTTEVKLLPTILEMEQAGVPVDVAYLKALREELEPAKEQAEQEFNAVSGVPAFNLNSHPELASYLYEHLKLKAPFLTRKKQPAVSMDALQCLSHPVIPALLRYADANSRLKFVDNLLEYVDEQGLIHANFNQTGTVSGRFSCTDPNLTNIVKDPRILRAFVVAPGESMLQWDYSLLEMIPMALHSKDVLMLESLKEGRDLHRVTASEVFRVPYDKVTPHQRQVGKGTNFSMIFGVGKDKFTGYVNGYLPEGQKITTEQGLLYRERFHTKFTGPRKLMRRVSDTVEVRREPWGHHVKNMFGRVRRLPADKGYQGANFLCQSWGADLMKKSMVRLKKEVLGNLPIRQQVHDMIRVDAPFTGKQRDEFVREVARVMCDWPQFEVPLRTECKWTTTNWAEMKVYEPEKAVAA